MFVYFLFVTCYLYSNIIMYVYYVIVKCITLSTYLTVFRNSFTVYTITLMKTSKGAKLVNSTTLGYNPVTN